MKKLISVILVLLILTPTAFAGVSTNYTLTGDGATDIVRVAKAQVGKTKSDFGWSADWCAYFVCWAGRTAKANFPSSNLGTPLAVTQWFVNNNQGTFYCFRDGNYNSLISAGVKNTNNIRRTSRSSVTPQKGDLVIYLWSADVGSYNWSHIGIVDSFSGNTLKTVEGNTAGGKVATCSRSYDSQVVGIVRPNYAKSSSGSSSSSSSGVSLSLKKSSFSLDVGESATLEFTFTGTVSSATQQIGNSGICQYVTGQWKQSQHWGEMTFKALAPGKTTIKISLTDSSGKVLASQTANVTVKGKDVTASAVQSSVTIAPNETKNVTFRFSGDGISTASCGTTNGSVCTAAFGDVDWSQGLATVALTGRSPGTARAYLTLKDQNGKELFLADMQVTVSGYQPVLTVSSSQVGLNLVTQKTGQVILTLGGSFPAGSTLNCDSSNPDIASFAWGEVSGGGKVPCNITAKKAGSTTVTFSIQDSSGTVLKAQKVTVNVSAPTYTVSYQANGGSGAPSAQTKTYQQALTLTTQEPTRSGYVFQGWATSAGASQPQYQPGDQYTQDKSVTLYAVWTPSTSMRYRVNHYREMLSGGYELVDTDTFYGTTGATVTPEPKDYPGFITPQRQSGTISSFDDATLVNYYYDRQSYQVSLKEGGGISGVTGSGTYLYGETVTVSAQVAEGYQWKSWSSDSALCPDSDSRNYSFPMPAGNVTLTASAVVEDLGQQEEEERDPCAQGHTWGPWVTQQEASCESEGIQVRTCQICARQEYQSIAPRGHDFVKTELSDGTRYTCRDCGYSYTISSGEIASQPEEGGLSHFLPQNSYRDGMFRDVKSTDWFRDNVALAYELGLMRGTGSSAFSPRNNITLAETITLAARLHSIYVTGKEDFDLYDGGNWYDPYVNYARDEGIIWENYELSKPATREQFVHILAHALPEEALEALSGGIDFADSGDIVYKGDVDLLTQAGIINGIPQGDQVLFLPGNTITRAETAAIITRMAQPQLRVTP